MGEAMWLDAPAWFHPLRSPDWLLPGGGKRHPSVTVVPASLPVDLDREETGLRLALPVALMEALLFTTDADAAALTDVGRPPPDTDIVVSVAVSDGRLTENDPATGGRLEVTFAGSPDLEPVVVETSGGFGAGVADLPRRVSEALHEAGVRRTWAPAYAPPDAANALAYLKAQRILVRLLDPAVHGHGVEDPDERQRRREQVRAALGYLGAFAGRSRVAVPALVFLGGLVATHDAGDDAYLEHRLPANAICMDAADPSDPLYAISVLILMLLGDRAIAQKRAETLRKNVAAERSPALGRWLARATAVR